MPVIDNRRICLAVLAAAISLFGLFAAPLTLLIPGTGPPGSGLAVLWIFLPAVILGVLFLAPFFLIIDVAFARFRIPMIVDLALSALCGAIGVALWIAAAKEPLITGVVGYGAIAGLAGRAVQRTLSGRKQAQRI